MESKQVGSLRSSFSDCKGAGMASQTSTPFLFTSAEKIKEEDQPEIEAQRRRITAADIDEWERISRRARWNVFMTNKEQRLWSKLLPILIAESTENHATPVTFPWGRYKSYKSLVNNVDTILSVHKKWVKSPIDVPKVIYEWRKAIIAAMDEAEEYVVLTHEELTEWVGMVKKLRAKERFTDIEERRWFRRLAVIERMDDIVFSPFDEYDSVTDLYRSISSGLREMRFWKEGDEEAKILIRDEKLGASVLGTLPLPISSDGRRKRPRKKRTQNKVSSAMSNNGTTFTEISCDMEKPTAPASVLKTLPLPISSDGRRKRPRKKRTRNKVSSAMSNNGTTFTEISCDMEKPTAPASVLKTLPLPESSDARRKHPRKKRTRNNVSSAMSNNGTTFTEISCDMEKPTAPAVRKHTTHQCNLGSALDLVSKIEEWWRIRMSHF